VRVCVLVMERVCVFEREIVFVCVCVCDGECERESGWVWVRDDLPHGTRTSDTSINRLLFRRERVCERERERGCVCARVSVCG